YMEGKYTRIYARCFKADGELEIARWRCNMFTASDGKFVFKWQGCKKKKIEIVKDHDDDLLSRLKNNAHDDNKANVTRENIDPNEHVLCAAMSLPLEEKLDMVLSGLSKLEKKFQSEKRAQSLLTVTLIETDNRYAALAVEDPITESSLPVENINENNDPEPTNSHKVRQHRDVRK
ncbi:Hypothetical predicted protein, partial [Paramuricea clavata]